MVVDFKINRPMLFAVIKGRGSRWDEKDRGRDRERRRQGQRQGQRDPKSIGPTAEIKPTRLHSVSQLLIQNVNL